MAKLNLLTYLLMYLPTYLLTYLLTLLYFTLLYFTLLYFTLLLLLLYFTLLYFTLLYFTYLTSFIRKMPESPDSMYFSFFMLENTYHNFTRRGANSQEIVNAVSIMGPPGSKLYWNKVHNFLQILSTSSKIMAYVFWNENGEIHGI